MPQAKMLKKTEEKSSPLFQEMADFLDASLKQAEAGRIVKGMVLEVRPSEVLVDVGGKSEGVVPISEFEDISQVTKGSYVDVYVLKSENDDGMVELSKKAADDKIRWEAVLQRYSEGSIVEGVVKSRIRGGLIVDVDGVEAFLPGSHIDVSPVHNTDDLIGKTERFKLIKISNDRRNIILSRRELLEAEQSDKRKNLLATLEAGQRRVGKVKNITDFGVFVDLDGIDGLLHITDLSWGRVKHPSEVVQGGQELEVVILDVDRDRERVSLGLKQAQQNPWDDIETRYPPHSRLRGKVVNLVPYGAFVELEPGIEGLVHVSEFSWTRRIARASDVLNIGDEVDVVVLSVNKEEQKIALGIRQTEENPWDTVMDRYPVGTRVKGKVRNFTSYGAFVQLEDGIDGMIHVSDMSWARKINHPSEVLKKGDEVEAIVLEVSPENQRISLGLKQAQEDPWAGISGRYQIGQLIKGKISKLASFGAFVELEEGVDGLVHISQISDDHVAKIRDVLQPGQEVEARVIKIDPIDRRIGLSIKAAKMADDEFKVDDSMLEGLRPGEDLVDLAGAFDAALSSSDKPEEWSPGSGKKE